MQHGFYQSSAVFPSVPYPCGGVRFTITNWLTIDDINDMLHLLQMERNAVLKETGLTESLIKRNFKGINYTLNELAVEV